MKLGDVERRLVQKIAEFSERYCKELLSEDYLRRRFDIRVGELRIDWWEALKFFLSRVFYQGRTDELSYRVYSEAKRVLDNYFADDQRDRSFEVLRDHGWRELVKDLGERIGKGKVGRGRDIDMVKYTLEFISKIPDKNIVNHSMRGIEEERVEDLWAELQEIKSVGEKTSSFYLRDLVVLLRLEERVHGRAEWLECLQPIDTWVRKVCRKIGIEGEDWELRRKIVKTCLKLSVSPIRFNMGAWYVATHSLDLLLEHLERERPPFRPKLVHHLEQLSNPVG